MKRLAATLLFAFVFWAAAFAQEPVQHQSPASPEAQQQQVHPGEPSKAESKSETTLGGQLAEASNEAAGEEDETAAFKESPSVRWVAKATGLHAKTAYWLLVAVNFGVVAVLIIVIWKAKIPTLFRSRTAAIRKGMDEAQKASAEASRRLGEIEQRLAKLDSEIASMRAAAEADAAAEEARIREAAEEDKRKVVEMAEQEITAAARSARRELKAYAAELAVTLAERQIRVDANTDQALVRSFVAQLGESDGQKENR